MNQIPNYIQILQALATPAIALLAIVIGVMQWWTARQKLVLDLFEKRFQVFLDVRRIASEAQQLEKPSDPALPNEIIARARFLFEDDVYQALIRFHELTTRWEMRDPNASSEIGNHFERKMIPLFRPYLHMRQKLPGLFWR